MFRRLSLAAAVVVAAAAIAVSTAYAFQVSPMVITIEPSGSKSSYRMSVKNTTATPITVELQPFRMVVDDAGERTLTPEDRDLLVFPPQSVIPPGREQLVQVRYVGDREIKEPRMYLVRAAQLPISVADPNDAKAGTANVMIAFNINTHLFVSPPGVQPLLAVESASRSPGGDLQIAIRNKGDGIAPLRDARYIVQPASGPPVEIAAADVALGEVSALPPGALRVAKISAKHLQNVTGDVTASVQLP